MNRHKRSAATCAAFAACLALAANACSSDSGGGSQGSSAATNASTPAASGSSDTTASSSGSSSASSTPAASGGTAVYGVEQEFTAYNNGTASQVLAANAYVLNMVQPSVFIIQPDLSVKLNTELMDSVDVTSQDPQVVVYKVNPKAVWSDGDPIDCDDFYLAWLSGNPQAGGNEVDASGNEVKDDSGNPIPNFNTASTTGTEDISKVECSPDGKTITTTYTKQFVDYQSLFAYMIPAHIVEQQSGVADVTKATDPQDLTKLGKFWSTGFDGFNKDFDLSGSWYSISEDNVGENLILVRNDNYWGTPGNLDEVDFRLIPSADDQPAALANGDVQVIVPQPNPDLLQQLDGVEGITASVEGGVTFEHLDFNQANPILADVNVRKAIALCIDRQEIVDTLIKPLAPEAVVLNNRMYIPSMTEYKDNGAGFETKDVAGAKALLEQSGWTLGSDGIYAKDGKRLSLRVGRRDPNPRRQSIVELIAASCKDAGIELTDDGTEDFNSVRLPASDYDMALFGWVATPFQSSNASIYAPGGAQNWNGYSNPELTTLFNQANVEFDPSKRADLMNQIDQTIWSDMATLPLFQFPNLVAYSNAMTGVIYNDPLGVSWNANQWAISA